ncbi:MAG: tagaturonate reductase [Elusimicrobiota bacterium]|jgi:tagaturonate reductase|nr:tagaturonate reductase [Elusimicrobiota bacterium]
MKKINEVIKKVYGKYSEKVLQIGDGNFLRAFADWMIDEANEKGLYKGSIVVCAPFTGAKVKALNDQDCVYTLIMRGLKNEKPVSISRQITSISRAVKIKDDFETFLEIAENPDLEIVISNTTEAGIVYTPETHLTNECPKSFPAKMAVFLYKRYKTFKGLNDKGLIFLPCELNECNADLLKEYIIKFSKDFNYEESFFTWLNNANVFANTLVDRIVTGYPKDKKEIETIEKELGYKDDMLVASELYNLWIIEGGKDLENRLPFEKISANILWVKNILEYNSMKVRLLNGAHTSLICAAFLAGHQFVLDSMQDKIFNDYLHCVLFDEIMPTLDLPKKDLISFAKNVLERFENPYLKHSLLDIALNSCAKFNTRCIPSILQYCKRMQKPPEFLSFAFAAFIKFYQGKMKDGIYKGNREDGLAYDIRDSAEVIDFFNNLQSKNLDEKEIVSAVLSNKSFWSNMDLTLIENLAGSVENYLRQINKTSIKETLKRAVINYPIEKGE